MKFLGGVCASLLLAAALAGQTGAGSIQGTVRDASQAVVPHVKVTIVHKTTAQRSESSTNNVGFYLFPSLPAGEYRIEVEAAGMEKWQGSIVTQVGQQAVVDPVLKI